MRFRRTSACGRRAAIEARCQPAGAFAAFRVLQPRRPAQLQAGDIHGFHAVDAALPEETQQSRDVQRWPVGQAHRAGGCPGGGRAARAAQCGGLQAIVLRKGGIEPPHTAEAAGQRDLGDGQIGIGEQLLGRQQPARLQVLQRRDAQGRLEHAAQVPVAHAQAGRQALHGRRAAGARSGRVPGAFRIQEPQCLAHQDAARVLHGPGRHARCKLGSAAQAGPEAGILRLGGQREKSGSSRGAACGPRRPAGSRCPWT